MDKNLNTADKVDDRDWLEGLPEGVDANSAMERALETGGAAEALPEWAV